MVATHGAGLANLVYFQPGAKTRLIELLQASCINASSRVCQVKGLDYTAALNPDMPGQNADGTPKERSRSETICGSSLTFPCWKSLDCMIAKCR
ncbi:glycosyltransferase family 61 protein [Agrobacterium vitis]|nr:glycosyltransferase family 61 protein [Agrobacterium vitis]